MKNLCAFLVTVLWGNFKFILFNYLKNVRKLYKYPEISEIELVTEEIGDIIELLIIFEIILF